MFSTPTSYSLLLHLSVFPPSSIIIFTLWQAQTLFRCQVGGLLVAFGRFIHILISMSSQAELEESELQVGTLSTVWSLLLR